MADQQPIYSPFFGVMGAASAIIFSGKCSYTLPAHTAECTVSVCAQKREKQICRQELLIFFAFGQVGGNNLHWNSSIWTTKCSKTSHDQAKMAEIGWNLRFFHKFWWSGDSKSGGRKKFFPYFSTNSRDLSTWNQANQPNLIHPKNRILPKWCLDCEKFCKIFHCCKNMVGIFPS